MAYSCIIPMDNPDCSCKGVRHDRTAGTTRDRGLCHTGLVVGVDQLVERTERLGFGLLAPG